METKDILTHILPKEFSEYFELTSIKDQEDTLVFVLEEKNVIPPEHQGKSLLSKGFYPFKKLQDFPIRDKAVIFQVRCRKWQDPSTGKSYSTDWDLVAKGTSYTKGFATFLKGMVG